MVRGPVDGQTLQLHDAFSEKNGILLDGTSKRSEAS